MGQPKSSLYDAVVFVPLLFCYAFV